MSFLRSFLKPRVKTDPGLVRYVPGYLFDAGAESFAFESETTTTPDFITRVFPDKNFTPLEVFSGGEMHLQLLTLPPSPPQGLDFGGLQTSGLTAQSDYPDVSGSYYE